MKIRFCEHNKGKGTVYRRLKEDFPQLDIKIKDCMKQCGACREMPTAVVGKKKISGKNSDDLYRKILERLQHADIEK